MMQTSTRKLILALLVFFAVWMIALYKACQAAEWDGMTYSGLQDFLIQAGWNQVQAPHEDDPCVGMRKQSAGVWNKGDESAFICWVAITEWKPEVAAHACQMVGLMLFDIHGSKLVCIEGKRS